jgi:hypothetical protein
MSVMSGEVAFVDVLEYEPKEIITRQRSPSTRDDSIVLVLESSPDFVEKRRASTRQSPRSRVSTTDKDWDANEFKIGTYKYQYQ